MKQFRLLVALVALFALALPALAQTDQTGVIEGRVTDADGKPLAGVVVLAAQADGSYPHDAITNEAGRFRLNFLTPGAYNLSLQAEGFLPQQVTAVKATAAQTAQVVVTMPKAVQRTEQVTVVSSRPRIDTITTERSTTVEARRVETLPVSRTTTGLLALVPGVRESSVWGAASGQANSYQYDGVTVNAPGGGGSFLLPNVDWVDEFQVKGLGAGAEYGNFQGGVVNIVTKSGSNTFKSNIRTNIERDAWNASNTNALEAGSQQAKRWEVNADVSGPLIKDKLYYFFSVEQVKTDTKVVDTLGSQDANDVLFLKDLDQRTERKVFGKLSWQATQRDMFSLVAGYDGVKEDNRGLDSFTDPAATTQQDSPSYFYNASWARIIGNDAFLEIKATGYNGKDDRSPYHGETQAVEILGGDANLYRNAVYWRHQKPTSAALAANLDVFATTGSIAHRLKFGGTYEKSTWLEQRRRAGDFTWRPQPAGALADFDPNNPNTWRLRAGRAYDITTDWGGDIDLDTDMLNAALYVQDYMTITQKLGINAGVRFGKWTGKINPGFGSGPEFTAVSATGWDPRVGLTYDFTGKGEWVAKAHFGRYHQNLFSYMFDRVSGGNAFKDVEYWDWKWDDRRPDLGFDYNHANREDYFDYAGSNPTGQENGPAVDYKQPYVDEFVLSLERALPNDWKLGINYIRRVNKDLVALVDRNRDRNFTAFHNVAVIDYNTGDPATDQSGRALVLPTVFLRNDDLNARNYGGVSDRFYQQDLVLTNPAGAERKLDQVQLTLEKAAKAWSVRGSIVYSDLRGNFDSVSGYEDTTGGTGAGGFVYPNTATNWYGRLSNNSLWTLKLDGTADLSRGWRGGVYYTFESGVYYTPTFTIDTNNYDFYAADGSYLNYKLFKNVDRQTIYLESQGSRKADYVSRLDVHLDKAFSLGKKVQWIFGIDVFNLMNSDAITDQRTSVNGYDPENPTTWFNAARLRQDPRTLRLSSTFRW